MMNPRRVTQLLVLLVAVWLWLPLAATAQGIEDCLMCHEDPDLTGERDGEEISVFVDLEKFNHSVHGELECISCHLDLEDVELPHEVPLEQVECSMCHDDVAEIYDNSLHGKLVLAGAKLAPHCRDCHGTHDILPPSNPDSRVTKFNIPFMCGRCHKEGTEVSRTYDIPQDSILAHYSLSIHGEGLYKQGLTVTAVCSDCHSAHNVLPHTDPESSIHRDNVSRTCAKCHGLIEEVHQKVIQGELWSKQPNKIPVCIECHEPHEARKLFYEEGVSDRECMDCHSKSDIATVRDGVTISLQVDSLEVHDSVHRRAGVTCAQCHTGATPSRTERACVTVTSRVDCAVCHAEVVETHQTSIHGTLAERGDPDAPICATCHGIHGTRDHRDTKSPTYPTNVPELCGQCHRAGEKSAQRYTSTQTDIIENYEMSIHGKGLLESGLVVTAMCTDCHTAHRALPANDPESSVFRTNIPQTCANCHKGIYEKFTASVHSPTMTETDEPLPNCADCHSSHTITRTGEEGFKLKIIGQCGSCHEDVTDTYFETIHGKVSRLGYAAAAKCQDCHGAHNILPTYDPKSTLSRGNIVATCGECHEGSHRRFAGDLTHATHHDKHKYPILFYTFWFMSFLLIGTLAIAGLHTILWLPRSFQMMRKNKKLRRRPHRLVYRRFTRRQRQLHVLVIISFLGLAVTGMTLKFSYLPWAQWLSELLGGFESAGFIHRICAVLTFFYFGAHVYDLFAQKKAAGQSWIKFLLDHNSMLPNKKDWRDLKATMKWFFGRGPHPSYGRWTYWEKFDYFAVFWGVLIIGSTGLMLWFPEIFTRVLPGWFINVATIVHSDEALLATGFIFTVHFFNTHFRPDKFPMDTVIFTGTMPIEEFQHDRPDEYHALMESRQLKKYLVEPMPAPMVTGAKWFGTIALVIGISLILLIIWAEVFGYR